MVTFLFNEIIVMIFIAKIDIGKTDNWNIELFLTSSINVILSEDIGRHIL